MASGKVFEAVVSIAGQIDPSLEKSISKAQKSTSGFGKGLKIAGAVGAAGLVAIGTAAVATTKGLFDLGQSYKDASNTIRIGTGATGEALDELNDSMKEVYQSVPTNLDDASTAIADLNTRLGLTGDNLEIMAEQSLMVTKTLGDDTSGVIEESSQAFQQWNIAAEDMSSEMDYIFKVSQSTGMGFTELMSTMQSSGASLQALGYSFDESAAMIGSLQKAGLDETVVLSALKKGLGSVAETGGDVQATMTDYISKIKNASTETDKIAIASEIFGKKAAPSMVQAIDKGALSADELTKSLQDNRESILGAAEDTYKLSDRWEMLKSKGANMLEPMANKVLEIATNAFPMLENAIDTVMPVLQSGAETILPVLENISKDALPRVQEAFNSIAPVVQMIISVIMIVAPTVISVMNIIQSVVWSAIQNILPIIIQLITEISGLVQQLAAELMPFINQLQTMIQPIIAMITSNLIPILRIIIQIAIQIIQVAMQVLSAVLPIVMQIIQIIAELCTEFISQLLPSLISIFEAITPIIQSIIQLISEILPVVISILQMLMPIIQTVATVIGTILGTAINYAIGLLQFIIGIVQNVITAFEGIITFMSEFVSTWRGVWENVSNIVSGAFSGLVGVVKGPINTIIGLVNGVIDKINGAGFKIPDWVPGIGGKDFKVNVQKLPLLAAGGHTEGPSIAGEAGQETVISYDPQYREKNIEYWKQAGQMLGINMANVNGDGLLAKVLGVFSKLKDISIPTGQVIQPIVNTIAVLSSETGRTLANDKGYDSILERRTVSNRYGYTIESVQFNPTIIIQGNASKDDVSDAINKSKEEFFDMLDEWWDDKTGGGDYDPVFG